MNYIFIVVYIIETKKSLVFLSIIFLISSKGVIINLHLSTCVSPLQKLSNRSTISIMKDIMNINEAILTSKLSINIDI